MRPGPMRPGPMRRGAVGRAVRVRSTNPPARAEAGFSFIELMISTLLTSMVVAAVVQALAVGQELFEATSADDAVRQRSRVAVDRIIDDIRLTGFYDDDSDIPEALMTATATSVAIAGDIDNGSTAPPCTQEDKTNRNVERVTYQLTDDRLERKVECWKEKKWKDEFAFEDVVTGIRGGTSLFRYFSANGAELVPGGGGLTAAERSQVVAVAITIDVEDTSLLRLMGDSSNPRIALTTRVRLRNVEIGG